MTNPTVHKIGGTSTSAVDTVVNDIMIGDRQATELYNRVFVVSAYSGMTDLLLEHKKTGEAGVYALYAGSESEWAWGDALTRTGAAMHEKNRDVLDDSADIALADRFVEERIEGVRSCLMDLRRLCSFGHFKLPEHLMAVREMLCGVGEAHSAHNLMLRLQRADVNATFVDLTGWRENGFKKLDQRIAEAFVALDLSRQLPIVTGYVQCEEGLVGLYGRGYSELTFSRIAVEVGAVEAVIHKEFHLSSADPKLVGAAAVKPIAETNYDVADQLSNMGMEAIHPSAAKGLRQACIPLRIKNTFEPESPGAVIRGDLAAKAPAVEIITGLKGVYAFEFFEQDMVGVKGYDAAILETLKRHKAQIVAKTSNANTITHFLKGAAKAVKRVEQDLNERFPSAVINSRNVAVISILGRDLRVPALGARVLTALAEAGIEPLGFNDLLRKVDMQVIVDEGDHDACIRALHRALIERAAGAAASSLSAAA
ncbi:MAG: aspartate kinase [Kiloniellaceae bacterium]|nr:aspartate kinase [Kiloniellaceae bacterium]